MEIKLRPWELSDLTSLVKYANNPKIAGNMTDAFPSPYTEKSGRAFISMAQKGVSAYLMAIEVEGEAVGGIGIHRQSDIMRKNAELGYWLAEPFWGKGITSQAVQKMVEYAFNTFDINRIYARPFGTNTASQRVLEKSGFTLEARIEKNIFKKGEYLDELIYA
ncbi:MAG TPA: GNAT family protein, partial [Flavobacteriales bacterium]|nr:GNAT family protein [Flavobacteriales bacterium]